MSRPKRFELLTARSVVWCLSWQVQRIYPNSSQLYPNCGQRNFQRVALLFPLTARISRQGRFSGSAVKLFFEHDAT